MGDQVLAGAGSLGLGGRPRRRGRWSRQRRRDESLGADVLGYELGVLAQAVTACLIVDRLSFRFRISLTRAQFRTRGWAVLR